MVVISAGLTVWGPATNFYVGAFTECIKDEDRDARYYLWR